MNSLWQQNCSIRSIETKLFNRHLARKLKKIYFGACFAIISKMLDMTKMVATSFLSLSSELHNRMREMRET